MAQRRHEYVIKINHPVGSMEVDIQQPLRSTNFAVSPPDGEESENSVKKGFNHLNYILEDIAKGEDRVFKISYAKDTKEPSVDVKYASMTGRKVWGSPYDTQRNVRTIIYAVFGTGIVMVSAALFGIIRTRRRRAAT